MRESAKYVRDTLKLRDTIESAFIALGERFYRIREEALWQGIYESYAEFLTDMRVSEATASKLMQVYRTYIVEHKIAPVKLAKIGWSNLYIAIPLLQKNSIESVIEKAASLRRADIEDEVRDEANPNCQHDWEEVKLRVCNTCGRRERVS